MKRDVKLPFVVLFSVILMSCAPRQGALGFMLGDRENTRVSRISEEKFEYTDKYQNLYLVSFFGCFRKSGSDARVSCLFFWGSGRDEKVTLLANLAMFSAEDSQGQYFVTYGIHGVSASLPRYLDIDVSEKNKESTYVLWEKSAEEKQKAFIVEFAISPSEKVIHTIKFDKRISGVNFTNVPIIMRE